MNRLFKDKETGNLLYLLRCNEDNSYLCCHLADKSTCKKVLTDKNTLILRKPDRVYIEYSELVQYAKPGDRIIFEGTDYYNNKIIEIRDDIRVFDRFRTDLDYLRISPTMYMALSLKYLFNRSLPYRTFMRIHIILINDSQQVKNMNHETIRHK